MQVGRYKAGVVTKGNKMFVVGGYDDKSVLKTSEVYDSITQKFTFIATNSNIHSKSLFCTHSNGNNIVVVHDQYYCFYHITSNTWSDNYDIQLKKIIQDYSCVELSKLIK